MVTSKLVHLYSLKRLFLFSVSLIFLINTNVFSKSVGFDQAVFRITGRVFFYSDILEMQKALDVLSCVKQPSFLSYYMNKKISELRNFEWSPEKLKNEKIVEKVSPYLILETLKLNLLSLGKDTINESELAKIGKKCTKLSWSTLSVDKKAFLLLEFFLRERFTNKKSLRFDLNKYRENLSKKEKHEYFEFKEFSFKGKE